MVQQDRTSRFSRCVIESNYYDHCEQLTNHCYYYLPQVLDAAHAQGCTHWDTADLYNDSEALLGKWCVPAQLVY